MRRGPKLEPIVLTREENNRLPGWARRHKTSQALAMRARNVRANFGLNKSILDQVWFEFRRQLDYKLRWKGGCLFVVPPQYTSRTCPCCGHVSADNRQTQSKLACVNCGYENYADVVGAINVLRAGHTRFACEVSGAAMPRLSAAGIPGIHAGEDVNGQRLAETTAPESLATSPLRA